MLSAKAGKETPMDPIRKQLVVDDSGQPQAVIIGWDDFQRIEEMLGLDLDESTLHDLRECRKDRESGNEEAYVDLDSI
jgi:PHD/YefM family antitoxin component YafN of YafNO toxin-antitoxin module